MSPFESVPFHGGITPLYVPPFTTIAPCKPPVTMPMTLFGSPVTTSFFASGGNAPGWPCPLAPWHDEQLVLNTFAPLALAGAAPAADCAGGGAAARIWASLRD